MRNLTLLLVGIQSQKDDQRKLFFENGFIFYYKLQKKFDQADEWTQIMEL